MSGPFRRTDEGLRLAVLVQPRAARERILGVVEGRLKIALNTPPVEGRANQALIRFLAKKLKVAKSGIRIVSGERSRRKELLLPGLDPAVIESLLD